MPQSREACDRCHAMKNRCVRTEQSQACQRCDRLGVSCNYSPPGRTGRPRGSQRAKATCREKVQRLSLVQNGGLTNNDSVNTSTDIFSNSALSEGQQTHPSDFDLLAGQLYSISDDSTSIMADLLPDGIHNTVFPTLDTFGRSTSILENPTDLEQATISTTGPHTPPAEEPRPPDQHSLLNRLLEIQPQLLKLVLRFSERSNTTDDVEDIYRVTETMVSIMDQMEGERLQRVPGKGFDFNGIGVLVMSGCYFSLIQAYQYLADMLSERASAASAPGTGDMADSSLPCLQKMSVPTISVGGLRLAMSRKAAAEVNLHLVAHTVYYLKDALQKCAKRMDKRRSSQRSCYDGLLDLDGGPLEGHGKMKTMVCQAVDRLNEGEEKLLDHLHTIVGASNNRIFRMG